MTGRALLLAALLSLGACAAQSSQSSGAFILGHAFEARPCAFDTQGQSIACGIISVPENGGRPRDRWIDLNIVVLRAAERQAELAALFEFEGGPGLAATDLASFYMTDGAPYRRTRDVVLVDMRGAGASNSLRCHNIEAYRAADRNAPMYPPALVAACAESLAASADIAAYNTNAAVADMDAIIRTLGYRRVALIGSSYGSTLAMALMTHARYQSEYRIDAAIILGAAPAGVMPPSRHAQQAQRALELYLAECADEPACAAAFPDLSGDIDRIRARYETAAPPDGPATFEIFMEKIRERMYAPSLANSIPRAVHAAAQGDFSAFAQRTAPGGGRIITDGVYLSITCAESFPHFDLDAMRAEARATWFGDYRLRVQRAACDVWPVEPRTPLGARAVPNPDVPVLFISGRLDPVTEPNWAEQSMRAFPNSRHILVEDGGHGHDGLDNAGPCMDAIWSAFLDDPRPDAVDASCVTAMTRPPFALN